jgi:hypothetical protein
LKALNHGIVEGKRFFECKLTNEIVDGVVARALAKPLSPIPTHAGSSFASSQVEREAS